MTHGPEPGPVGDLVPCDELSQHRGGDHQEDTDDREADGEIQRAVEDPLRGVVHPSPVRLVAGLVVGVVEPGAEAVADGDPLEHRRLDDVVDDDARRGPREGGRGVATLGDQHQHAREREQRDDVGQGVVEHDSAFS